MHKHDIHVNQVFTYNMIRAVIIVFAVMLLVPVFANGDESIEQWKQYVESYRQYMEKYREWAHNTINLYKSDLSESEQTISSLENKIHKLEQENLEQKARITEITNWARSVEKYLDESNSYYEKLKDENNREFETLKQYADELDEQYRITIHDGQINWNFKDSKGNRYGWQIPIESFERTVKYNTYYDVRDLSNTNTGETYSVPKLSPFVQKTFTNVIDQVWDNSENELHFVGNVWFIVNQLTTYSFDLGEYPRYPTETLGRGGGDCEDLAILIADMLLSSKHTQDWELEFFIMDSNNPKKAQAVNHVILRINDGKNTYYVEPTATNASSMLQWNDYDTLNGWTEKIF